MKKCTKPPPPPPPPPPDPCELQKIKQAKQKAAAAGKKECTKPPPCPEKEPEEKKEKKVCNLPVCLCIERVKNPPLSSENKQEEPVVCVVERQLPGQDRCDKIRDLTAADPDLPLPRCPVPPPPPPPPKLDPCEQQERRAKIAECKERMKRYLE